MERKKITPTKVVGTMLTLGTAATLFSCGAYGNETYKVNFETNGGNSIEALEIKWGETYVAPTPTKKGHTFAGWYLDKSLTKPLTEEDLTVKAEVTLYAKWTVNSYTVTFMKNEEEVYTSYKGSYNTSINIEDPTMDNYSFAGWYLDNEFNKEFNMKVPAENTTVYGKWATNVLTVKFNKNADEARGTMIDQKISVSTEKTLTPNSYTRTGYDFMGWSLSETGEVSFRDAYEFETIDKTETITLYAVWIEKEYNVNFIVDDLKTDDSYVGRYKSNIIYPAVNPSKTGYTFSGWKMYVQTSDETFQEGKTYYTNVGTDVSKIYQEANVIIGASINGEFYEKISFENEKVPLGNINGDVNIYAEFERNNYTISFVENGGSKVEDITQAYNSNLQAPTAPTRTGYTFTGWYTDEALTTKYNFVRMPAENITLYGGWSINEYTISFDTAGGSEITPITLNYGEAVNVLEAPTKLGYTFDGWDKEIPTTMPAENMTITAKWKINQYTLTIKLDNGEDDIVITQDFGSAIASLVNPEKTGYSFSSWSEAIPTSMPAEDKTITALWNVNQYTLSFNSNGGTKVDAITLDYGSSITAPQDPTRTGYTFAGWSEDIPATMPAENKTLTAKWTINQYTLTLVLGNGEDNIIIKQDYNSAIEAQANPSRTGYTFAGWDKVIPSTMPAENVTVNANWTINQYTISFNVDGGSQLASIKQDYGTEITAPSNPTKTGYTFDGWDKEIPTSMPAENMTITAKWKINQYTLTIKLDNGEDDIVITQDFGSAIASLVNPEKTGYSFSSWSEAIPTSMPAENKTITALWNVNQYSISFVTNGGSAVSKITEDYEKEINAPEAPNKVGYSFAGWYSDAELKNAYTFSTMPAENITLYAKWDARTDTQYTVNHYKQNVNDDNYILFETTHSQGTTLELTGDDAKDYVGFDAQSYEKKTINPDGTTVIDIYYERKVYTVSFVDKTTSEAITSLQIKYGGSVSTYPTALNKTGYTYSLEEFDHNTVIENNTEVKVIYTIRQLSILLNGYDKQLNESVSNEIIQDYNSDVVLPDVIRTGYTFTGWYTSETVQDESTKVNSNLKMPAENLDLYAGWSINEYTLTIVLGNGQDDIVIKQNYGSAIVAPYNPSWTGHTFASWSEVIPASMPAEDKTITALWNVNQYSISFVTNGGSEVTTITQDYESVVTKPADPIRTGYTFTKWYSDAELKNEYTFSTMPAENITLYAGWSINEYTLTIVLGNGQDDIVIKQNYATEITAQANPERLGYTFTGWDKSIPSTMPAEDVTVNATWAINQYTLTLVLGNGQDNIVIKQDYASEIKAVANPSWTGHTFASWSEVIPSSMPAENKTIIASWTVNKYSISFVVNGGSEVATITQDYESVVTKPADPTRTGYTFAGWYVDDETFKNAYTFTTMPLDGATLYAKWDVNEYTIQFNSNDGSHVDSITQDFATSVTKPADPIRTGYTFTKWYSDAELKNEYTFSTMPAENITLYAGWSINEYTLTIVLGNGQDDIVIKQNYATEIAAQANPERLGYTFAGWDKSIPSTMPAEDVTVNATWNIVTYSISYNLDDGSLEDKITEYNVTSEIIINNPTKVGHTFLGWTYEGQETPKKDISIELGSTGNKVYTANWEVNEYTLTLIDKDGSHESKVEYGGVVYVPNRDNYYDNSFYYVFSGWDKEVPEKMPASDVTLTAQYTKNMYRIIYIDSSSSSTITTGDSYKGVVDPFVNDYLVSVFTEKSYLEILNSDCLGIPLGASPTTLVSHFMAFSRLICNTDAVYGHEYAELVNTWIWSNFKDNDTFAQLIEKAPNETLLGLLQRIYATAMGGGDPTNDALAFVFTYLGVADSVQNNDWVLRFQNLMQASEAEKLGAIELVQNKITDALIEISLEYNKYYENAYYPVHSKDNYVFKEWNIVFDYENGIARYNAIWDKQLDAPTELEISKLGSNKVTIVWDAVEGAESYEIYVIKNGGEKQILESNTNSIEITGLDNLDTVIVTVVAINDVETSGGKQNYDFKEPHAVLTQKEISLNSVESKELIYVHSVSQNLPIDKKSDYTYVDTDNNLILFTQSSYTFSNATELEITSGSQYAYIDENGELITKGAEGTITLHYFNGDNQEVNRTAYIKLLVQDIDFSDEISKYKQTTENIGDSEYINKVVDSYLIGKASTDNNPTINKLGYGTYELDNIVYSNGYSFNTIISTTSGIDLDFSKFDLEYTFYKYNETLEDYELVNNTASLFVHDEENDVFYFLTDSGKYKVTVSFRRDSTDYTNTSLPEKYKVTKTFTNEFVFELNNGVNVYTNDDLRTAVSSLDVSSINIHADIEAQYAANSVVYLPYAKNVIGTFTNFTAGDVDIKNRTAVMSTSNEYGPTIWVVTNDASEAVFTAKDGKMYAYDTSSSGTHYSIKTCEWEANFDGGKFKIINVHAYDAHHYGTEYTQYLNYHLDAANLYQRVDHENNVKLEINGNYFTIDASKLPYLKSEWNVELGGVIAAYKIQNVQTSIFQFNNNGGASINNLVIEGNTMDVSAFISRNPDSVSSVADYMAQTSGGIMGVRSVGGTSANMTYFTLEDYNKDYTVNLDNVIISNTTIGLYANTGGNLIAKDTYVKETWANSQYAHGANLVEFQNCIISTSGGGASQTEDIYYTIEDSRFGVATNPYLQYNIGSTTIENYVAGDEQWFKAYSMEIMSFVLKSQVESGVNAAGYTIILKQTDEITGLETERFNFVYFSKDDNIGDQINKNADDISGGITLFGTEILNAKGYEAMAGLAAFGLTDSKLKTIYTAYENAIAAGYEAAVTSIKPLHDAYPLFQDALGAGADDVIVIVDSSGKVHFHLKMMVGENQYMNVIIDQSMNFQYFFEMKYGFGSYNLYFIMEAKPLGKE